MAFTLCPSSLSTRLTMPRWLDLTDKENPEFTYSL
jgi:hypothetical protein